MTEPVPDIVSLKKQSEAALHAATTPDQLESWRRLYLGRKGKVPLLLRQVKDVPAAQRKQTGQQANQLRVELTRQYEEQKMQITSSAATSHFDVSVPGH